MSRLDEWRRLLAGTRHLPGALSRELRTLHGLAEAVPEVEARVGALEAMLVELTAAVRQLEAGVTAAAAGDQTASALERLAARTTDLERSLEALAAELGTVRRGPLADLGETVARLGAEGREQALVLEAAIRDPARAAAEAALRARLPAVGPLADGVSILVRSRHQGRALAAAVAWARAGFDGLDVPGEIVLSLDPARDDGLAVAGALAAEDGRIRLVGHDAELGAARTRNVQLAQARFRHALVVDADDAVVPSAVAALHASLAATNAVAAYGPILVAPGDGRPGELAWAEPPSRALYWESRVGPLLMVDVEAVRALGGFEPAACGLHDLELLLRLAELGRPVGFVPAFVGSRRAPAPGASQAHRRDQLRGLYASDREPLAATHHPALGFLAAGRGVDVSATSTTGGPRILVVSSGGVRNHGDDAILRSTLERLARLRPHAVPVVVTDGDDVPPLGRLGVWAGTTAELCRALDPAAIRTACHDATLADAIVARSGAAGCAIDPALRDVGTFDAVLLAGGGNLASPWPDLVAWRTAVAVAARSRGVPVIVSGQGVGPVSDEVLPMLALLVESAGAFAVRDPGSLALLAAHGLAGPRTAVAGDDALGLAVDVASARAGLEAGGLAADASLLGFQARVAGYVGCSRATLLELARTVDRLAAARGATVLGVPMNSQPPQAEDALQLELQGALGRRRARFELADVGDDAVAAAAVLKTCAAVVTCSFHAALFALEAGIPTALVAATEYYARKADALREVFGLPAPIAVPPDASAEVMAATIDALASRAWQPTASSAVVDRWLDGALAAPLGWTPGPFFQDVAGCRVP
jgi:polysaccharide pyruvyl transferase WcaK-like protein